jgi:hypothetical protein
MTFSLDRDWMTRVYDQAADLRYAVADSAATIADTEDNLAATLERLARNRPQHATRLQGKAADARRYAALERQRASRYRGA